MAVMVTMRLQLCAMALVLTGVGSACKSGDYPRTAIGAELQENALSARISANTLQFITDNLESILRQNLPVDETGEYALISLSEGSDAAANVFCDEEGKRWPGEIAPCDYNIRVRDGCLGPGEQDKNGKCPDIKSKPRESQKSSVRVRIADLAAKIHLEMEDPGTFTTGGFRMIIKDLTLDLDLTMYAKLPLVGGFTCRYHSPVGQVLKIEKVDISMQARIDIQDGKPVMFATSITRDLSVTDLALTAEAVKDPACPDGGCTAACQLADGVISVGGKAFNFVNDLLKPALPYIVTPIANAALSFLWGKALEFNLAIPVSKIGMVQTGMGRDVKILASAQPGAFAVNQKGSGKNDPTRGTGVLLSMGAYAERSPCVDSLIASPTFAGSALPPALDGSVRIVDPSSASGNLVDTPYDLGLVIGESFFNQAAYSLRNSGLMCIALGSDPGGLLATGNFVPNAGLLYLIAPPLASLAPANAPIFFRMKPGGAPSVRFGSGKITGKDDKGNPIRESLITLSMFDTGIEFHLYAWGRYIRTFTLNVDVQLGMSIIPTKSGKIMLSIDSIKAGNIVEQFNELMPNYDFSKITEVLFSILSTQLSSTSLAFELPIRDTLKKFLGNDLSVRLLELRTESSANDYLGMYLKLCSAADETDPNNSACFVPTRSATRELATLSAQQHSVDYDDAALTLQVVPPADGNYEYQVAIDSALFGPFAPASAEGLVRVRNPILRVLGRHRVSVRARRAGEPVDTAVEPFHMQTLVDPEPPRVTLSGRGVQRTITGEDLVTAEENLVYQVVDGSTESPWTGLAEATAILRLSSEDAFVLARDEAGNLSNDPRASRDRGPAAAPSKASGCAASGESMWAILILAFLCVRRHSSRHARSHSLHRH